MGRHRPLRSGLCKGRYPYRPPAEGTSGVLDEIRSILQRQYAPVAGRDKRGAASAAPLLKYFRFRSPLVILLQHGFVGEKAGIVEIFGSFGTVFDAGLAFDADAGDFIGVFRIDGPHGTHLGAFAAVIAFGQVRLGLGFQELGRLAVFSQRDVVGGHRGVSVDAHSFQRLSAPEFSFHPVQQFLEFFFVLNCGMIPADSGKGVGSGKGTGSEHPEILLFQFIPKFRQRAVVTPVAEGHQGHSRGLVFRISGKQLLDRGQGFVGNPAGIGGHPEDHQGGGTEGMESLLILGQGEGMMGQGDPFCLETAGQLFPEFPDQGFRLTGGTERNGGNMGNQEQDLPKELNFQPMDFLFIIPYFQEKSQCQGLPFKKFATGPGNGLR
nr:MAG TPA: hypothetical protein [Caudoviricetes sp.]